MDCLGVASAWPGFSVAELPLFVTHGSDDDGDHQKYHVSLLAGLNF